MNNLARYGAAVPKMQVGDLVAFSGKGIVSGLIEAWTGSALSHVGLIRQVDGGRVLIIESTIAGKRNGVKTNDLEQRLAEYDSGAAAWLLRLRPELRCDFDLFRFYEFCGKCDGIVEYDTGGLFEFFARAVPFLGPRIFQREHADRRMFCSAFATQAYEAAGILRGWNSAKTSPEDLVDASLWSEAVQILGEKDRAVSRRFNTV